MGKICLNSYNKMKKGKEISIFWTLLCYSCNFSRMFTYIEILYSTYDLFDLHPKQYYLMLHQNSLLSMWVVSIYKPMHKLVRTQSTKMYNGEKSFRICELVLFIISVWVNIKAFGYIFVGLFDIKEVISCQWFVTQILSRLI